MSTLTQAVWESHVANCARCDKAASAPDRFGVGDLCMLGEDLHARADRTPWKNRTVTAPVAATAEEGV